jgi:hypothetical protein
LLVALLRLQLTTKGLHVCGIIYTHVGKRCSGDTNTSIGNGVLNRLTAWFFFCECWYEWRTSHEGDDGLGRILNVPLNVVDDIMVSLIADTRDRFGMVVKTVQSPDLHGVTFCGRAHYWEHGRLSSYCDISRTLRKFHITTVEHRAGLSHEELMKSLLLAKCNSYLCTDGDTPLIGPLCRWLRGSLDGVTELVQESDLHRRKLSGERSNISMDRRWDVALRYGMPIIVQLSFEAQCCGMIRQIFAPIMEVPDDKEDNYIVFPGTLGLG